jgi:hypothetical protein
MGFMLWYHMYARWAAWYSGVHGRLQVPVIQRKKGVAEMMRGRWARSDVACHDVAKKKTVASRLLDYYDSKNSVY